MVKIPTTRSWIKTADLNTGDELSIVNEGASVESKWTYDDGTPRQQFVIKVNFKGEEKDLTLNRLSQTNLAEAWGNETADWVGNLCRVEKIKVMVGGEMKDSIVLLPVGAGSAPEVQVDQEGQDEIPF